VADPWDALRSISALMEARLAGQATLRNRRGAPSQKLFDDIQLFGHLPQVRANIHENHGGPEFPLGLFVAKPQQWFSRSAPDFSRDVSKFFDCARKITWHEEPPGEPRF
jgi:hypothetical protein